MNMKKIFAAMAATAVSASAFAAMTLTNANAADQIGQATLMGQFGTESSWDYAGTKTSVAAIDGDAQYECKWTVSEATSTGASNFFVTVVIEPAGASDNFTTATFPNLAVTLDEVWVDGTQLTGYDASNAIDMNYYEGEKPGVTRIYLRGDWASNSTQILANDLTVESEIKVLFTIAGTGQEGTSNVTEEEPTTEAPTTTEAPATTTAAAGTTTTGATTTTKAGATTTKAANGGKTETSTNTGVAGVGVAASALALAGVAAFVARKKD